MASSDIANKPLRAMSARTTATSIQGKAGMDDEMGMEPIIL
jgi:hypothetical protein